MGEHMIQSQELPLICLLLACLSFTANSETLLISSLKMSNLQPTQIVKHINIQAHLSAGVTF